MSGKSQWTLPAAFIETSFGHNLEQEQMDDLNKKHSCNKKRIDQEHIFQSHNKDLQLVGIIKGNNVSKTTTDGGRIVVQAASDQTMKLPSISSFDSASSQSSPTSVAVGSGCEETFFKFKLSPSIALPPTHLPSFVDAFKKSLTRSASSWSSADDQV